MFPVKTVLGTVTVAQIHAWKVQATLQHQPDLRFERSTDNSLSGFLHGQAAFRPGSGNTVRAVSDAESCAITYPMMQCCSTSADGGSERDGITSWHGWVPPRPAS